MPEKSLPSFESAPRAIKEAHRIAEQWRYEEKLKGFSSSPPVCIWRSKLSRKADRTKAEFLYTLSSSWEEKPEDAGKLVMTVSASGTEIPDGPWGNPEEFAEALKG